ncbi:MAG: hypothetical protein O3A51_13480 [Verrucomicrobia bacterium]|nr:hypothetical protein [Verrucomicrobiota bacterium]
MDLKFMESQSRALTRTLFKRDYDAFTESARRTVNWVVLAADVAVGLLLLEWLL